MNLQWIIKKTSPTCTLAYFYKMWNTTLEPLGYKRGALYNWKSSNHSYKKILRGVYLLEMITNEVYLVFL